MVVRVHSTARYAGQERILGDLFGATTVDIGRDAIVVDGRVLPLIDDVIIAIDLTRVPPIVRERLAIGEHTSTSAEFAPDIQHTFGEEWKTYGEVLPEHRS